MYRTSLNGILNARFFSFPKAVVTALAILISFNGFAQEAADSGGDETFDLAQIVIGLLLLVGIAVVFVVLVTADRLLKISGSKVSDEESADGIALLPGRDELLGAKEKVPHEKDASVIKLKQGFDINVAGKAVKEVAEPGEISTYAVKPKDWVGLTPIPKVVLKEGDEVKAGDILFYDKKRENLKFTSPVSGEFVEIRRGAKRSIEEVVILADKGEIKYREFPKEDPKSLSREQVVERMVESGTWVSLRQRPFNTIADPDDAPKGIFISGFDSGPLGSNLNFTLAGEASAFQAGIDALNKLAEGKVHLSLDVEHEPCDTYMNVEGVKRHWFKGPHPAGLPGVQIHHIAPLAKGEVAWTINPLDVIILGRLFQQGIYDTSHLIAVAGPEVKEPKYYKVRRGANVAPLLNDNLENDHVRAISGNVLTGQQVDQEKGHLGFFDNQLSVVEEGDFYEMFGWLVPSYGRPSLSPTFPWTLFPAEEFNVNTNTHGEERAFVVTGEYEKVTPMDIYPQHLLKAIMARDFEKMEGLGIYEVVEEDLALCEFVCTSKVDVQKILREGLEYVREQS